MALKRGSNVDYGKNEIQNARVQNLSSAPSSPVEGQIYYDTTLHQFGYYNGTTWVYGTTIPDASGSTKGIVQLANDLGGTATAPTVVNLHLSGDTSIGHKLTGVTDPGSAQDAATKNYVDITAVQIGTDIGGTVTAPQVVGLHLSGDTAINHKLTGVTDPTGAQDAATKSYVDNKVNGLAWKNPVAIATAAALPAYTQSGAGATGTLTANASATLTVDGYAVALNDRVLVKDGAAGKDNGIYKMTQLGDGSHPYILVRDSDATTAAQLQDATVMVEQGTANADTVWNLSNAPGFTVDTTGLTWVQIQSGTAIVGDGTYTTRSTNQIKIILSTDEAAASVANGAVAATAVGVARIIKFVFKGDSSTNPFTLTHNLNTRQVQVVGQVDNSGAPGAPIELDWAPSSVNAITITFPSAPTTGTPYYVSVTG